LDLLFYNDAKDIYNLETKSTRDLFEFEKLEISRKPNLMIPKKRKNSAPFLIEFYQIMPREESYSLKQEQIPLIGATMFAHPLLRSVGYLKLSYHHGGEDVSSEVLEEEEEYDDSFNKDTQKYISHKFEVLQTKINSMKDIAYGKKLEIFGGFG